MHINFETTNGRRVLIRLTRDSAEIQRYVPGGDGVWSDWTDISFGLAARFLSLPAAQDAIRSEAAWAVWEQAGPFGSGCRPIVFDAVVR